MFDGARPIYLTTANQRSNPTDFSDNGADWETLGAVQIFGDTLVVKLFDDAEHRAWTGSGNQLILDNARAGSRLAVELAKLGPA